MIKDIYIFYLTCAPFRACVMYGDKCREIKLHGHAVVVIFAANIAPSRVKRVESHLRIILQKRRRLHICITFACVNTSAEAHTLSSYPIYLGENAPSQALHRVRGEPPLFATSRRGGNRSHARDK